MAEKHCKVTLIGTDGMTHSAQVTASSVFEAAAQGLMAIQQSGWANVPYEPYKISVTVNEIPVEHDVKYEELMRWVNRPGGRSPREIVERQRVRKILGIADEPRV
ncbi:MAG: hypothetical protein WA823_13840 [Candidatus Acidiferrales bacterium]